MMKILTKKSRNKKLSDSWGCFRFFVLEFLLFGVGNLYLGTRRDLTFQPLRTWTATNNYTSSNLLMIAGAYLYAYNMCTLHRRQTDDPLMLPFSMWQCLFWLLLSSFLLPTVQHALLSARQAIQGKRPTKLLQNHMQHPFALSLDVLILVKSNFDVAPGSDAKCYAMLPMCRSPSHTPYGNCWWSNHSRKQYLWPIRGWVHILSTWNVMLGFK
jgi:hypothetical protein